MISHKGDRATIAAMFQNLQPSDQAELLINATMDRKQWMQKLLDPRRDIDAECGFAGTVTIDMYRKMYDRDGLAHRVVSFWPEECWQTVPEVYEDEDEDAETEFEKVWTALDESLRGVTEKSYHTDDMSSVLWEYLKRADEISGIGHYGVILLGIDDGKSLREPVDGFDPGTYAEGTDAQYDQSLFDISDATQPTSSPGKKQHKLLFVRVLDESLAQVTRYESRKDNPRYGLPVMYQLTFNDPRQESSGAIGLTTVTESVHYSRVVHIADNLVSSEVVGEPRMKPVWNYLYSAFKISSGSGEMFWKGAFPGYAISTHPQLGGDVAIDIASIREQMQDYENSLQRWLALMGMSVNALAPQVSDPTAHYNLQVKGICIKMGVPERIFMGSERGELASSQDDDTHTKRVKYRQQRYIIPRVIVPFINRLIGMGVLPEPKDGFRVKWDDARPLKPAENADVAQKVTAALAAYISGGVDALIDPLDYLVGFLNIDKETAQQYLKNTQKRLEDLNPDAEEPLLPGHAPTQSPPQEEATTEEEKEVDEEEPTDEDQTQNSNNREDVIHVSRYGLTVNVDSVPDGRKLNKPFRTPGGPKKFAVYTTGPKGTPVLVRFGDPDMEIKRDDPERRKGFRARHSCDDDVGPKWKARYWSCKFWSKESVRELLDNASAVTGSGPSHKWLVVNALPDGMEFDEPFLINHTQYDTAVYVRNENDDVVFVKYVQNDFDPKQARDKKGRWTSRAGETLFAMSRSKDGTAWEMTDGSAVPSHVKKLAIPPAWKSVYVNPDPNGTLMARGIDSKGRTQSRYSDNHSARQAAAKFGRVSELRKKRQQIFKELDRDAEKPALRDKAECLKVIMQTGIRPGSTKDTGADYESFGATTIQGRHVVKKGDSVSLIFATEKNKGREVEFPINDPETAKMLLDRAKSAGSNGRLFNVEAADLSRYSKSKDGKGFKTKDHRTALGTETAIREINNLPAPKTMKEYKTQVKQVATVVSRTLGNTPNIALKSYIDPTVFAHWKITQ